MNGVEYGFIPDLDEMSLGEYIDLDNNITNWETMQVAMNVLFRPVKIKKANKYSIEDYMVEGSDDLKQMPLDAVISSIFFLHNLGIELSIHTMNYSQSQMEEELQGVQTSEQSGVGINQFTDSLTEILQNLKISLN